MRRQLLERGIVAVQEETALEEFLLVLARPLRGDGALDGLDLQLQGVALLLTTSCRESSVKTKPGRRRP